MSSSAKWRPFINVMFIEQLWDYFGLNDKEGFTGNGVGAEI